MESRAREAERERQEDLGGEAQPALALFLV